MHREQLFTYLKNKKGKIDQDPNYLRTAMREDLHPYVKVKYAGALVLARYYREATPVPAKRDAYF